MKSSVAPRGSAVRIVDQDNAAFVEERLRLRSPLAGSRSCASVVEVRRLGCDDGEVVE
jgi:hypothetical protein